MRRNYLIDLRAPGTTIIATLANPTGLAIGRDGAIYVAQKHTVPGGGEVLRIVQ